MHPLRSLVSVGHVNTTIISPSQPTRLTARAGVTAIRRYLGRWALIAALAALPVYYGVSDLVNGYQAAVVARHHDLSKLGFNFAEGLSDGAISAQMAPSDRPSAKLKPSFDRSWWMTGCPAATPTW